MLVAMNISAFVLVTKPMLPLNLSEIRRKAKLKTTGFG